MPTATTADTNPCVKQCRRICLVGPCKCGATADKPDRCDNRLSPVQCRAVQGTPVYTQYSVGQAGQAGSTPITCARCPPPPAPPYTYTHNPLTQHPSQHAWQSARPPPPRTPARSMPPDGLPSLPPAALPGSVCCPPSHTNTYTHFPTSCPHVSAYLATPAPPPPPQV